MTVNDGSHTGQTFRKNNTGDYISIEDTTPRTMRDGASYTFFGLSQLATVQYVETGKTDSAGNTYKVQISNAVDDTGRSKAYGLDVMDTEALKVTTATAASVEENHLPVQNDDILFTNSLNDVSPTGVVLRFAPYIIMAGVAVVLLVIMSRRRRDTQDKSNSI